MTRTRVSSPGIYPFDIVMSGHPDDNGYMNELMARLIAFQPDRQPQIIRRDTVANVKQSVERLNAKAEKENAKTRYRMELIEQ